MSPETARLEFAKVKAPYGFMQANNLKSACGLSCSTRLTGRIHTHPNRLLLPNGMMASVLRVFVRTHPQSPKRGCCQSLNSRL